MVSAVLLALTAAAQAPVETSWGTISEPSLPSQACATLPAHFTSQKGSLDHVDGDGQNPHPDQKAIQSAIDHCTKGAVKLVTGPQGEDAFLTGPLTLKSGVTLWVDKGVTLYASRNPADYDVGTGDCGTANQEHHHACRPLIGGHDLVGSGLVGDGRIDGRGGSRLTGGPERGRRSWWDLAWLTKQGLTQHVPLLMVIEGGHDFLLYRLTFANSPNFHLVPRNMDRVTAWGIRILTPTLAYSRPSYACPPGTTPPEGLPATCFTPDTVKNTDGFDPSTSSRVLLAYSYISTGDDNVAVKAGRDGPSRYQVYAHNHFYYGHGMSIGSETDGGLQDMKVIDLTIDGYDSPVGNGLRIKSDASRGGLVRGVSYQGVCMRRVAHPLVFDSYYSDRPGTRPPRFEDISLSDVHYLGDAAHGGGVSVLQGYQGQSASIPVQLRFDHVSFEGPPPRFAGKGGKAKPALADIVAGPGSEALAEQIAQAGGDHIRITRDDHGEAAPPPRDCAAAFVPLSSVLPDSPI